MDGKLEETLYEEISALRTELTILRNKVDILQDRYNKLCYQRRKLINKEYDNE